jgi:hypothetical protein
MKRTESTDGPGAADAATEGDNRKERKDGKAPLCALCTTLPKSFVVLRKFLPQKKAKRATKN